MQKNLDPKSLLKQILKMASDAPKSAPLETIFDLDSTLYCVSFRTEKILHRLGDEPEFRKQYPQQAELLKKAQGVPQDWGIKTMLKRLGIQADLDFFETVREYWIEHFFSSQHLHHDRPYPGAVEYLEALKKSGAHIRYLTGRDRPRMGEGTLKSLDQWGFPLEKPEYLIMKPQKELDDSEFKREFFANLKPSPSSTWFFENEPVIVNKILAARPEVKIVFMDSVHSGRETAPEQVHRIKLEYVF